MTKNLTIILLLALLLAGCANGGFPLQAPPHSGANHSGGAAGPEPGTLGGVVGPGAMAAPARPDPAQEDSPTGQVQDPVEGPNLQANAGQTAEDEAGPPTDAAPAGQALDDAGSPALQKPGAAAAQPATTESPPGQPADAGQAPPAVASNEPPSPPTALSLTPTPTPTATPLPADYNPLTGLRVHDPSRLERRPLGIKITNFPRQVRPQWGLSLADIVFEYYLEHGLTRFFAIFYGNDAARVGPVRSARFFDEHPVRMYKTVFVFANADKKVLDHLLETELVDYFVVERPDNCPPMCRYQYGVPYNNLFTDTRQLTKHIDSRGVDNSRPDLRGMVFDTTPPAGGVPGQTITTVYSTDSYHRWQYDPGSGTYARFQETVAGEPAEDAFAPLTDRLTDQPIMASNVVLLLVPHAYFTVEPEIVTMTLWGSGQAFVFRDGKMYRLFWQRPAPDAVLRLTMPDGTPFPLKPGVTFFEVVGQTSRVWQFGEAWRFDFQIP